MYLGLRAELMQRHLELAKLLIPLWSNNYVYLKALLCIYDPTSPFMAPILYEPYRKRDCSYNSVVSSKDSTFADDVKLEEHSNLSHDMSKLFLGLLILLIKVDNPISEFEPSLVVPNQKAFSCAPAHSESWCDVSAQSLRLPRRGVAIACGYAHAAAVINADVFTWGRSFHGCLGRGSARREWSEAESIPLLRWPAVSVLSVACGAAHTLAMTDMGVYAWGLNCYGQLGIGSGPNTTGLWRKRCHPTLVTALVDVQVVAVACGQYHSLALSNQGVAYSWGWGVYGQLGHGNYHNVSSPQQLTGLDQLVVRLDAGYAHSLFLTTQGDVLVSGCGTFGQLGSGKTSKENRPIRVDLQEAITLAAAGYFHNVAVGTSGRLFTWGCHPQTLRLRAQVSRRMRSARQMTPESVTTSNTTFPAATGAGTQPGWEQPVSDPSRAPGVFTPAQVELADALSSEIVQVACGANHSLFLTADGDVFTWGRNLDGQLGQESRKERTTPTQVQGVLNDHRVVQGACGADFTLLLDDTGRLWALGIDDCGQISGALQREGRKDSHTPSSSGKMLTVRTNKRVVQIKSPTRHGVYKPLTLNALPQINAPVTSKLISHEAQETEGVQHLIPLRISPNTPLTQVVLHSALEQLRELYDANDMAELCECWDNVQAAAKVLFMHGQLQRSFRLNLRAISGSIGSIQHTTEAPHQALQLFASYMSFIQSDVNVVKDVLKSIMLFWSQHQLETDMLEQFFRLHVSTFLCPLASLLFSSGCESEDGGELSYVTSRLSTDFCMSLVSQILDKVKTGQPPPEMLNMLCNVVNLEYLQLSTSQVWPGSGPDDVPPDNRQQQDQQREQDEQLSSGLVLPAEQIANAHLWAELTHNLCKDVTSRACIDLSAGEVESMLRDMTVNIDGSVAAVFTCGHQHAWHSLRGAVLQRFRQSALVQLAPQTTRQLLDVYSTTGFQPMACPQCVLKGVQEEKA